MYNQLSISSGIENSINSLRGGNRIDRIAPLSVGSNRFKFNNEATNFMNRYESSNLLQAVSIEILKEQRLNKSRAKSRKYLGISPCVSSSNLSNSESLNTQSISKLYVPKKPKPKKVNLALPKGPVSGIAHMTILRREIDGGVMVFRNGENLSFNENFYRPIVIQTKEKAIDKKALSINMNERK